MSQSRISPTNISLNLSEVLSDIGVNERLVQKRRRMYLLMETLHLTFLNLNGISKLYLMYNFGSQSEGSTTLGLNSDTDILYSYNDFNVVQDRIEQQQGKFNLLMIQDESTSPGYCLLHKLRDNEPLPLCVLLSGHTPNTLFFKDKRGRVLLKNCLTDTTHLSLPGITSVRNGPAETVDIRLTNVSLDFVIAFPCKAWPDEAKPWLVRQGIGAWPTEETKRYCETTGCFVVPVSSKSGRNEELEWRISTAHAERCLMFSLNITQIRCYILMKMILKTFINPHGNGVLSSFMCKTVLFHCIQNTHTNQWQEHNSLECLNCCLNALSDNVTQTNCPHFIIPGNNLMAGRISPPNKQKILEILQYIIQSEGRALLEIPIDELGLRLRVKMNTLTENPGIRYCNSNTEVSAVISAELLCRIARSLCLQMTTLLFSKGSKY